MNTDAVRARATATVAVGVVAFCVAALALWLVHDLTRARYRLSAPAAIAAARAYPPDGAFLASHRASGARVIPLDGELQRVTFFDGAQDVLDAAVGPHGEVRATEMHRAGVPASGSALANSPWLLALLSGVFLLATLALPLRSARNLDALVLASMTATVPLINARLVAASVALSWAALLYLIVRCAHVGLREPTAAAPPTPLLAWSCARWDARRFTRLLAVLLLATTVAFALVTLSSSGYTDVAVASLQGATELLHGTLPYGHVSLALHGDTYPLLNYLLYVPGALWHPVANVFADMDGSLATALAASLLAGLALYRIGGTSAGAGLGGERPRDRRLRAALAWFAFPPVLLAASGGANDLLLAASLAWALALYTRAGASLLALVAGAWIKLVPLVLLAIWLPARRAGGARAFLGAGALSVALLALLLALGGGDAPVAMLRAMSFQFQRGSFYAPWYTFSLLWLQPLAQAGVLTLALLAALRVRADHALRADPVRMAALAGALLLGVQACANYWTWSYLPWALPFLILALFLGDARPRTATRGAQPSGRGRKHSPSAAERALKPRADRTAHRRRSPVTTQAG
ncbi:MAG TPA: hypothetical protein VKV16_07360 [Solirubrobacteraceae bacterium]|nr:hypothetical protein [Solirubrobacteraceae bacterium]